VHWVHIDYQNTNKAGLMFEKGKSGNPNGRPKQEKCFSAIARQLLKAKRLDISCAFTNLKTGKLESKHFEIESEKTIYHALVAVLAAKGLGGDIKAIQELVDRVEGKALQVTKDEATSEIMGDVLKEISERLPK